MHLFLIASCAIFSFPLFWMFVASLKTDEEVTKTDFFPKVPTFKPVSPYLKPSTGVIRPEQCPEAVWKKVEQPLKELALERVSGYATQPKAIDVPVEEVQEQAADYLLGLALRKFPRALWLEGNPDEFTAYKEAFERSLEASAGGVEGALKKAFNDVQARFWLGGVKLRSRAGQVIFSSTGKTDEVLWSSEGADVTLDADGKQVVKSDFSDSKKPATLSYSFVTKSKYADLHRLLITVGKDNSYHQIDAEVTVNGVKFRGTRTIWLAQHNSESIILQFPTASYKEWGKRPWVKLEQVGGSGDLDADELNIDVKLKLSPSTTAVANYGKAKRNYERIFLSMPFWTYVGNSIVLTLLIIFGAVFSSVFVAYAFARLKWPGRSFAFVLLLSSMMLPPQVTMIPQFLEWRALGLYNTLTPLWLPAWFGIAFFIFLMVQQMKGIPRDLEEAAEVDGMNRLQVWWYVIVPLVRPAMAAIAIMSFMSAWNEFMAPLIYLRDMGNFPLSVGNYALAADDTTSRDMSLLMAGNILMTLPVIIIFFLFQRYFIQGVASAGVKG